MNPFRFSTHLAILTCLMVFELQLTGEELESEQASAATPSFVNSELWQQGDVLVKVTRSADTVKGSGKDYGAIFEEQSYIRLRFDYEQQKAACFIVSQFDIEDFGEVPGQKMLEKQVVTWSAASYDRKNDKTFWISDRTKRPQRSNFKAIEDINKQLRFLIHDFRGLWKTGHSRFDSFERSRQSVENLQKTDRSKCRTDSSTNERKLSIKTKVVFQETYPGMEVFTFDRKTQMLTSFKDSFEFDKSKPHAIMNDWFIKWEEKDGVYVPIKFRDTKGDGIPFLQREMWCKDVKVEMDLRWISFGKEISEEQFDAEWAKSLKDVASVTSSAWKTSPSDRTKNRRKLKK